MGPRASANEIVHAILMGTPIPGTTGFSDHQFAHERTNSAPDTTGSAPQPQPSDRMAIGWKPQLNGQMRQSSQDSQESVPRAPSVPPKLVQSVSAGFLSRFSPDPSPNDDEKWPHRELEKELDARVIVRKPLPVRRSWSAEALRYDAMVGATDPAAAAATMLSRMPRDIRMHRRDVDVGMRAKMQYEQVKNKPLPRIAVL